MHSTLKKMSENKKKMSHVITSMQFTQDDMDPNLLLLINCPITTQRLDSVGCLTKWIDGSMNNILPLS